MSREIICKPVCFFVFVFVFSQVGGEKRSDENDITLNGSNKTRKTDIMLSITVGSLSTGVLLRTFLSFTFQKYIQILIYWFEDQLPGNNNKIKNR